MVTQDTVLALKLQIQARSFIDLSLKVQFLLTPSIVLSLGGSFQVSPLIVFPLIEPRTRNILLWKGQFLVTTWLILVTWSVLSKKCNFGWTIRPFCHHNIIVW